MKAVMTSPALVPAAEDIAPPLREVPSLGAGAGLLARLEGLCTDRGLLGLAGRLGELAGLVGADMVRFEEEFAGLPRDASRVGRAATRLLELGGKRLRPMCVILAARVGSGFDRRVLDLAVAVELVHSATLLHDDVVDMSDSRRGAATARAVYGNAASIFAGDWLLIEALRRVQRCRLPGLVEELFDTIEEMIFAESVQLESRGRVDTDRELYFQVVEGKTASVFRWAMSAGAAAAGLVEAQRRALAAYGTELGIAFQAVDDLLDLTGDSARTGKALFTDLREGKMTYPVILALEREPTLRPVIEEIVAADGEEPLSERIAARVVRGLERTRAVADCLALARRHSARAVDHLGTLPASRARRALATVAEAIVDRDL